MPEIGEVRIIADNITHLIDGKILTKIEILTPGYKQTKKINELNASLPQVVCSISTKGKFTYIELKDGNAIGIGLGMTGNIRIEPTPEHCHLKICYKDKDNDNDAGKHFYYYDVRRFGRWEYLSKDELNHKLSELGSDLIHETLTDKQIITAFRRKNTMNICKVLMDQKVIAGVGAYIKSEILYHSKIHPLAKVINIPDESIIKLYQEAQKIALNSYYAGGASLYTFTGIDGKKSDFKNTLVVYGKARDPNGYEVIRIPDSESPDKRTTHWVKEVQTIGAPISPISK